MSEAQRIDNTPFFDGHTSVVARTNAEHGNGNMPKPPSPWQASPPTCEPWRSTYLALTPEQQQRWDGMSPVQRRMAFGV